MARSDASTARAALARVGDAVGVVPRPPPKTVDAGGRIMARPLVGDGLFMIGNALGRRTTSRPVSVAGGGRIMAGIGL